VKLEGDYRFDAAVQDVWNALFDPAVLAAALPGCEKLDLVDGAYVGEMTIKVGPISGKFTGKVQLEDKVEPSPAGQEAGALGSMTRGHYKMIVDGRGPQGFMKATAAIGLAADGDGTKLHYDADAQIGGKIASVGQRLIDASARAITKQALDNLHENIKRRVAEKAPVYKQAEAGDMAKAVAKEVGKTLLPMIVIGVVAVAVIAWWLLR
jgi:uncharacterized protein